MVACRWTRWLLWIGYYKKRSFFAGFLLLNLGSCGVVLGPMTINIWWYQVEFQKFNNGVLVQGKKPLTQRVWQSSVDCKCWETDQTLRKLISTLYDSSNSSGKWWRKWHPLEVATDKHPKEKPALLEVLLEFFALFEKTVGLPPSRGVFDHRIVLHSGVEPMNKRPYRYPSVKKG